MPSMKDRASGQAPDANMLSKTISDGRCLSISSTILCTSKPVWVFLVNGEIDDVIFGKVEQRAVRLRREMAAKIEIVVHDARQPAGGAQSRKSLGIRRQELHKSFEDNFVGHLAAHGTSLDLGAAQIGAELAHQ
jgi:hypothetical protein